MQIFRNLSSPTHFWPQAFSCGHCLLRPSHSSFPRCKFSSLGPHILSHLLAEVESRWLAQNLPSFTPAVSGLQGKPWPQWRNAPIFLILQDAPGSVLSLLCLGLSYIWLLCFRCESLGSSYHTVTGHTLSKPSRNRESRKPRLSTVTLVCSHIWVYLSVCICFSVEFQKLNLN